MMDEKNMHGSSTVNQKMLDCSETGDIAELRRLLLDDRADVHFADSRDRQTGLINACERGNVEMVKLFLEAKADIDHTNAFGYAGLSMAAFRGHTDCVQLLLNSKATVDLPNVFGYTALTMCAEDSKLECVKLLLEHHADVEHKNHSGHTALTKRARIHCRNADLISFLLICCGAHFFGFEKLDAFMETTTNWLTTFHSILKGILSEHVVLDTRIHRKANGLYHEPLERVMQYCGLELLVEGDPNVDEADPIPQLLRDRKERVNSAWYWWNQI